MLIRLAQKVITDRVHNYNLKFVTTTAPLGFVLVMTYTRTTDNSTVNLIVQIVECTNSFPCDDCGLPSLRVSLLTSVARWPTMWPVSLG